MRIVTLKGMRQINGLHYAPDGRRLLAVGGYEEQSVDEAQWVDPDVGIETVYDSIYLSCYAVSPDLSRMAIGRALWRQEDGETPLMVFDPTAGNDNSRRKVDVSHDLAAQIYGMAFAPDGRRLAISYDIRLYHGCNPYHLFITADPDHPEHQRGQPRRGGEIYSLIAFHPDGHRMAVSRKIGDRSDVAVLADEGKVCTSSFAPPNDQTRQLAFSPDGHTLAVANATAVLLLPPDLSAPRLTLAHPEQVNAVAFTPDGRRVLTTCTDKLVRVWDTATGQLVVSYDWNVGVTNAIAVAPDGLTATVSGQTGRVVLFDLDG